MLSKWGMRAQSNKKKSLIRTLEEDVFIYSNLKDQPEKLDFSWVKNQQKKYSVIPRELKKVLEESEPNLTNLKSRPDPNPEDSPVEKIYNFETSF